MSWELPALTVLESAESSVRLRQLLRMTPRRRKLLVAGAVGLVAAIVLLTKSAPSTGDVPEPTVAAQLDATAAASRSPDPAPATAEIDPPPPGYGKYSIYTYQLPGLAPDAEPGSKIDIWVTWKPPVTKAPKVQLLVEDVTVQRIALPYDGDGALIADLILEKEDIPDLIYGQRFGSLNATSRS